MREAESKKPYFVQGHDLSGWTSEQVRLLAISRGYNWLMPLVETKAAEEVAAEASEMLTVNNGQKEEE